MLRCIVPMLFNPDNLFASQLRSKTGDRMSSPARSVQSRSVSQNLKPEIVSQEGGRGLLDEFNRRVARRAYERFDQDGRVDGNDLSHWFEAENEVAPPLPSVRELADSFVANILLPEVSGENVKVYTTEDRAIVCAENRSADDGRNQSPESIYYMIRWPEPVDISSCTADMDDGNLTLQIRKANSRPLASLEGSREP
jgi:HSP20 family molecular chaperone IbpA